MVILKELLLFSFWGISLVFLAAYMNGGLYIGPKKSK